MTRRPASVWSRACLVSPATLLARLAIAAAALLAPTTSTAANLARSLESGPVERLAFREVVTITGEGGRCAGAYVGLDAALTSARCVCRLGLDRRPTTGRVQFAASENPAEQTHTVRAARLMGQQVCPQSGAAETIEHDLAVVRFRIQGDARLLTATQALEATEAAVRASSDIGPTSLALPALYLLQSNDRLFLIDPAEPAQSHAKRYSMRIVSRICSRQQQGCRPGVEAHIANELGTPCTASEGAPVYVSAPPGFALAGIQSRVSGGNSCVQVMRLLTPETIDWIVRENGIPVIACRAPGDCSILGAR